MTVKGTLWLAKRYASTLISVFLTGFRYFLYQVAVQLSSQDWVDPVTDLIRPEKIQGYSRESNPGPLEWQSDVLTTIPNSWSPRIIISVNIVSSVGTLKFRDSRNREKFKNSRKLWGTCFKIKLNIVMWVLTRELLANFGKSAFTREFLLLLAKFRRI